MSRAVRNFLLVAGVIAVAAGLTIAIGDPYLTRIATKICIYAIAASAVHLLISQCGLASFGHAGFFAIGGYIAGIAMRDGFNDALVVWPMALLSGLGVGVLIGLLCLRTRGLYFLMVTLAFAQMNFLGLQALRGLGGDDGFRISGRLTLMGFDISGASSTFVVALVLLLLTVALCFYIEKARLGAVARAGRDSPHRLASLGIDVRPYNLAIFAISAGLTALAGAMYVNLSQYVSPALGTWLVSGEFLIMVIMGGVGTLWGPVIGAALLTILEDSLVSITDKWPLFLGVAILLRVFFWGHLKRAFDATRRTVSEARR